MKFFLELSRLQKQMVAAIADLLFLPLAFCLAIYLRYDALSVELVKNYFLLIVATPLISIPIFIKLGLYRAVIRFIDQKIVYVVAWGVTLSVLALATVAVFNHIPELSRAVFIIYWAGAVLYVVASRFIARGYLLFASGMGRAVPVAIYGAGQSGSQLASALRAGHEYLPVAFIDDNKDLQNATIAGVKVFSPNALKTLIDKMEVREILLAMPALSKTRQKHLLDKLEPFKVKIKVTPPIKSLINGELRLQDVREVGIEDLLGRDQVEPDPLLLSTCIADKTVLVTGAGGSIGSELCRQIILLRPKRLLLMEISEFGLYSIEQELLDIRRSLNLPVEIIPFIGSVLEQEKCKRLLSTFSVDTVYHAAAYKHVPLVEHNPIEGVRNNALGTLSIAQASVASGVKNFVLISTDKAVRPTNVMGSSKRLAELILQALSREQKNTHFCMVRFGNVLGSSGSVVPLFRKQILDGGPITITHPDITRYFMTIPEAAQLVLQASSMGEGGDVFVLDMGEPVKIMDLAKRMVHLSGLEIKTESTPDGTIEIKNIGLRPGEKLYEELLIGEHVEGTEHPLIMRAQEAEIPWAELQVILARMDSACHRYDYEEVRALLLSTVTEYEPQCGIEDFLWRAQNKITNPTDDLLLQ